MRLLGDPRGVVARLTRLGLALLLSALGFCHLVSLPFLIFMGFQFPLSVSPTRSPGCWGPRPLSSCCYLSCSRRSENGADVAGGRGVAPGEGGLGVGGIPGLNIEMLRARGHN